MLTASGGGDFVKCSFPAAARSLGRRPLSRLVLRTANMSHHNRKENRHHHPWHGPSGLAHARDERHEEHLGVVLQRVVWWLLPLLLLWFVVLLVVEVADVDVGWLK